MKKTASMEVNSPGSTYVSRQSSPNPLTPRSPRHFVFPQKAPKSPVFGPKSPKSPNSNGIPHSASHCGIESRSPKSPVRFDFEKTAVYESPKSPQSMLKHSSSRNSMTPKTHITTNPGYQIMNSDDLMAAKSRNRVTRMSSGSTSVYSDITFTESNSGSDMGAFRRCRKSTSDLTDCAETSTSMQSSEGKPRRRRGSSKGGLAYLANRRSSRDSAKSHNGSTTSIFSNEDVGPLAFQKSERGRQRRTSNFLELPGKYLHSILSSF